MLFTSFEKYLDVQKGVIHVGAHDGQERFWYEKQGFDKVLWFEPNKEIFPRLLENIHNFKNHKAFNVGVHDTLKEAILHISSNDGESSSLLSFGTHSIHAPGVKYIRDQQINLVRMDEFLKVEDININEYNFLNIDVQGVELNVIKSFGKLIGRLDYIYAEVNMDEVYIGCSRLPDIDIYLRKFGFLRMAEKMASWGWGDAFYKKYK